MRIKKKKTDIEEINIFDKSKKVKELICTLRSASQHIFEVIWMSDRSNVHNMTFYANQLPC